MSAPDTPAGGRGSLLSVELLEVHFSVADGLFGKALVRAVDRVTLDVARGETLGLVGESGSGKSTLGRAIVQVEPSTSGEIWLDGRRLSELTREQLRRERRRFQMVFQDPRGSMNPRRTIAAAIAEPLEIQRIGSSATQAARVDELLNLVGLDAGFARRYPHQLSGGQLQRVSIARALSAEPEFIVCDEPVSSLDVSVQAQIINLFQRLQVELGIAYLFISHDLAVVRHLAQRVAVMYMGKIVETGSSDDIYERPLHPYTKALLSAVPEPDARLERARNRIILQGEIPSPTRPPSGCRFRTRCPWAQAVCADLEPPLRRDNDGHLVACHFFEEIAAGSMAPGAPGPIGPQPVGPGPSAASGSDKQPNQPRVMPELDK
ncbi:MAG: ABC transporter ATP-binding protein [Chloroflexi bacterium]|nr:ABC transporter ATP-binding protein [Chloroflexota bacterium]